MSETTTLTMIFTLSRDLIHFTNYSICFPIYQHSDILWLCTDLKPVWYFHFVNNICCSLLSWNNNARKGIYTEFIYTELLYCVHWSQAGSPRKQSARWFIGSIVVDICYPNNPFPVLSPTLFYITGNTIFLPASFSCQLDSG